MWNENDLEKTCIVAGTREEFLLLQMDPQLHFQKVNMGVRGHLTMPSAAEIGIFVFFFFFLSVKEMLYLVPLVIEIVTSGSWLPKEQAVLFCLPQIFQELGSGIMKLVEKNKHEKILKLLPCHTRKEIFPTLPYCPYIKRYFCL